MKLTALFAGLALVASASVFAAGADKVTLKDSVDAAVKADIEAAEKANKDVPSGFEWRDSKQELEAAIEAANDGDNDKAGQLAETVSKAAENGMKQAETAKNAGPHF